MKSAILIEACVESAEAAKMAEAAGADRIELCSNLTEGGLTPTPALIRACKRSVNIPVHVLIRPRSGDFLYTEAEFDQLCEELKDAIEAGADGLVWGCLNAQGHVDQSRCTKLMELSGHRPVTFHRAFDMTKDFSRALEDISSLGIQRVLTSGGQPGAIHGAKVISDLVKKADPEIVILGGGGIHSENVVQLISLTGLAEIHVSAMSKKTSRMLYQNTALSLGKSQNSEYDNPAGNMEKIKLIREALSSITG